MKNTPTVTFHAGALFTKPNTTESIEAAIKENAEIIEIDVSFESDNTPVMIHKDHPEKGEGEKLSTAFELISGTKIKLNLDLKSVGGLKELLELSEEYAVKDNIFFTGVSYEWTKSVKNLGVPYYLNFFVDKENDIKDEAHKAAIQCKASGAIGANVDYNDVSREFCEILRDEGLLSSLWTVDKAEDMKKVLAFGADNITTNRPDLLKDFINQINI